MNLRNLMLAVALPFLVSACSSIGMNHKESTPVEAITAIVKHYAKDDAIITAHPNSTNFRFPTSVAKKIMDEATYYCRANEGTTDQWRGGISCIHSVWRSREIFTLRFREHRSGVTEIDVAEKRQDDSGAYEATVNAWGYETMPQRMSRSAKEYQHRREAENAARERIMQERIRNRDKVAFRGAQVCQEADHHGRKIVFIGAVEQVEGDRIKVFVERSYFVGAPGLMPGNFQQHYAWVNIWDVTPCT